MEVKDKKTDPDFDWTRERRRLLGIVVGWKDFRRRPQEISIRKRVQRKQKVSQGKKLSQSA